MKSDGLRSPRGAIAAIALTIAGVLLAWLCFRTAVDRVLSPMAAVALTGETTSSDIVLGSALAAVMGPDNQLAAGMSDAVLQAAARRPLDARPYLILARSTPVAGQEALATSLLERSQRLDPRQRLTHVFLLDRYLRDGQYAKAAQQFSVLSRLVSESNDQVAKALVLMTTDPEMLPAVRRTLDADPRLEQLVLRTLANSDVEPARIFDLATPRAYASAGDTRSWGPALIRRLVETGRFQDARAFWKRLYGVSDEAAAALIYNATFGDSVGSAPFNWTFAGGQIGAADPGPNGLVIDYYGRETGDLVSQTLLLEPGRYRFVFASEGGKADAEARLFWQIACVRTQGAVLMTAPVALSSATTSREAEFSVPAGCPAQRLRLRGEIGEYPDAIDTTIRNIAVQPL